MNLHNLESTRITEISGIFDGDVPEYIFLEGHQSGKNTLFCYQYRDGANYKTSNTLVFEGKITPEQMRAIADNAMIFDGEPDFLPRQIDLKPLCPYFDDENYDDDIDHPIHTIIEISLTDEAPNASMTLESLVNAFVEIGPEGWDQAEYGN